MDPIALLQADVCRTLAHPTRIAMLHLLAEAPRDVGTLAAALGISQPNTSQHLAILRGAGLVDPERDGREVVYRLADPLIIEACDLMGQFVRHRYARLADIAQVTTAGTDATQTTLLEVS